MERRIKISAMILGMLLIFLVIGAIYFYQYKKIYLLKLPKLENLISITVEGKVVSDSEKMNDILYVLNGNNRKTNEESIQDLPVNVSNKIKIDFNFGDEKTSTVFIYERNNKYYIEQPYNGIYRISPDEYNSIKKYNR